MSILAPLVSSRTAFGFLLIAVFADAQNSEDGQGSNASGAGENPADAGSAGADTSGFSMGKGTLIAIITVVVVVAVLGGMSQSPISLPLHLIRAKIRNSRLRDSLRSCQEAPMGSPKEYPTYVKALDRKIPAT